MRITSSHHVLYSIVLSTKSSDTIHWKEQYKPRVPLQLLLCQGSFALKHSEEHVWKMKDKGICHIIGNFNGHENPYMPIM